MRRSRFPKVLDYAPPLVAFVAAIIAVIGAPKWDGGASGLSKLTPLGWAVFGLGVAALLTSLLVTKRNHNLQASQKAIRLEIARVGQAQLLCGLSHLVSVFKNSALWHEGKAEPHSPVDLLESDRRLALASLNLNKASPYFDGKDYPSWWQMFENTAKHGSSSLTTALQIYVTFLEPEIIQATTKLLNSEFMHRLQHMRSIIDANTRDDPARPVKFFWVSPDQSHRCGYEEFWALVAHVSGLCSNEANNQAAPWPA